MRVYRALLARGYFPKKLPPAFSTEGFAAYAASAQGRQALKGIEGPTLTNGATFQLAGPGARVRELVIPHPYSFTELASLISAKFSRLLKKAASSPFSRSHPVYKSSEDRALQPSYLYKNLARERMISRAGGAYVVKADINDFYPSLYTHAIGWAIDPRLRSRANWGNRELFAKKVDQALMNMQGKLSQGVLIGNDISYLLAEIVLGRVDQALRRAVKKVPAGRFYRWYDDYEISCASNDEAEEILAALTRELSKFRLRLNPRKTRIESLPRPTQKEWQQELLLASRWPLNRPDVVVSYFDVAFRQRDENPDTAVLNYALGLLFRITRPTESTSEVLQSAVTQALLCEPGVARKAFSLMSYWCSNEMEMNRPLMTRTINEIVRRHEARGVTSDVSWALAFCLEHQIELDKVAGKVLSRCDDDCVALQALHCNSERLIPSGFSDDHIRGLIRDTDLNDSHWLLGYEALRQEFSADSRAAVASNPVFRNLLEQQVTFYRTQLPDYAGFVHSGGAPKWIVSRWMQLARGAEPRPGELEAAQQQPAFNAVAQAVQERAPAPTSVADTMATLLAEGELDLADEADAYS